MRHRVVIGCVIALLVLAPATATATRPDADGSGAGPSSSTGGAWAADEIEIVVGAGLLGPDVASFRPDDPLTRGELHEALTALGKAGAAPAERERLVTIRELDARLVAALGALPASRAIRQAALAAGLEPTGMLGTETIARLLGLRFNHPVTSESLERLPTEPASRAEAAYSLARVLALDAEDVSALVDRATAFAVPALDDVQREILTRALRFVGYPYVFAGTSELPQRLWSATAPAGTVAAPGGFDCSGFVWRVYKGEPYLSVPGIGDVLRGRTSYQMSAEVDVSERIPLGDLQPGDVIFFGSAGPKSRPSQVGHMGIYVGSGWFVHSSRAGVTLQPLEGWYARTFAWARRPVAEAVLLST